MLELYQTEWCPYSHRVRMRLTELGVDVILRQAPAGRASRRGLHERTGLYGIPTLIADDGTVVHGADEIVAFLDGRFPAPAPEVVSAHRAKGIAERDHWEWPTP